MLHDGGGVIRGGRVSEGVLVGDSDSTSCLLVRSPVHNLVSVWGCYGNAGCQGSFFTQVSVMKTVSGVRVAMVPQSSVACFQREGVLTRMQLSSTAALLSVSLGGVWVGVSDIRGFFSVPGEAVASTGKRASGGSW